MSGSSTALVDPTEEALSMSRLLGSSLGSVSSPRNAKSEISKVYKQAEALFLTRRFPEALSTIEPLITISQAQDGAHDDEATADVAPIAKASPKSRIKVWSFYLTLLNAIAELGPEDGKTEFGAREWRNLVAKAQDGTIWDEVVNIGYGGMEGSVDADVVFNLASLLLAQSTAQARNQRHLESYLSASSYQSLDLTERFRGSNGSNVMRVDQTSRSGGTDTPRDLNARIRIIELYTLHVLPRTGEWNYARDFINMSEVLDEEIRDEFLQTLRSVEDEDTKGQDQFEDALLQQDELTEQEPLPAEETRPDNMKTLRQEPLATHHKSESEQDNGIDKPHAPLDAPKIQPVPKSTSKPVKPTKPKHSRSPPTKSTGKTTDTSLYKRSAAVLSALQQLIKNMTEQVSQNPISLLRFILFLMGLIVAFSRRDVKDRLGRLTNVGWDKFKTTVGSKLSFPSHVFLIRTVF
ncbi:MAG: hypothetical protein ALECFALPRED_005871 [Alectoria fallacina]|uniref:Peroxin 26 n=1 Tax=Alectoria fallacina TaxID=1903189 RepID=A0A8H3G0S4_9LECA|nr:MAG: hypothetical protein ALECFALPRED_005871 [Alectoria fallacina]